MNILQIIEKKQRSLELSKEEIDFFINNYTNGNIPDYQAAALIMAIYINGMNMNETTNLTISMANSGEVLNLERLGCVVDKHSTGGVGDKVSIILLPIIASLGIPVAKMSGRGLGFTGGTIDKLESIPGYKTSMEINSFIQNVEKMGISIIGQTLNLAPADKKIYSLRNAISCIDNKPLIASSIMSKKIAAGASKIVLDVTCGNGAFMKNENDAIELSKIMQEIGRLANKETVCIITNMDEPLGYSVGNILEVKEAVQFLKGNMEENEKNVILEIGAYIIKLAGKGDDIQLNKEKILDNIYSGKAYDKFVELVRMQNGDISYIENLDKFPKAKYEQEITSEDGYIQSINAEEIGLASVALGAGRIKKDDNIDNTVGIVFHKKVGDKVSSKEVIAKVFANDEIELKRQTQRIKNAIKVVDYEVPKLNSIIKIMC
ncbi:MAG: thymidine phosphorylase [Clostridia bacterium]|nr:thymidine phosphorylase [Clostridia bacterium]